MMKLSIIFSVIFVCTTVSSQRITTINLDGVQYYISRMNPYSPELNFHLAYQYCRSLGLQLASFETKEKFETMTQYLKNANYSKYDFWTSGNNLGTDMYLWMSTGLPFNSTFDFFGAEGLDPLDHNGNTAPQRTARGDDHKKGDNQNCVLLSAPLHKWMPENCGKINDFICEQTRCYYYNYGSIPVSSAQGRPITSTTAPEYQGPTTPYPMMVKEGSTRFYLPLSTTLSPSHSASAETVANEESTDSTEQFEHETEHLDEDHLEDEHHTNTINDQDFHTEAAYPDEELHMEEVRHSIEDDIPVEQKLRQITEEIEKYSNSDKVDDINDRQSFFSLSDLIKTLRPNDKKVAPQIDSDYSNTMRVLGETKAVNVKNSEDAVVYETSPVLQQNRALFKK